MSYTDPFGLSPMDTQDTGNAGLHAVLTAAGFLPVIGGLADLADAVIYLFEGDVAGAIGSGIAIFAGGIALGYKGIKGANAARKAAKAAKAAAKVDNLTDTAKIARTTTEAISNSSSFMKASSNVADLSQTVKAARQGSVVDKLKDATTGISNKLKPSNLKLNNVGAVDTRIVNPRKWGDIAKDGGVLNLSKKGSGNSLYRKMSKAEYDATMKNIALQGQIPSKDSSKWLSENYEKVKAFHNKAVLPGTEEFIVEFNMTDEYMEYLRKTAVPQANSKGLSNVKFHYEGLEINGPYKNYGITAEELEFFNKNIKSIIER